MSRLTEFLFFMLYALSALVAALVLVRFMGMAPNTAMLFGALGFVASMQAHSFFTRARKDGALEKRVEQLRKANLGLTDEIEKVHQELDGIAKAVEEEAVRRNEVIVSEVQALETVMAKMEGTLATRIAEAARMAAIPTLEPAEANDRHVLLTLVREALEAGRVELHLQPIVSLPQRKIYFYESFTRLRDQDGNVIMPAEFMKVAEAAGLMTVVDNLLLFRCVQIVRRLTEKDRQVGIVCNISPLSLKDEVFFPQFLDFMRQNADLAGSVVFEIGQKDFEDRGIVEARNMARLADFGFRFSIDKVENLNFDAKDMQRAGVKFFKASGDLLLAAIHSSPDAALPAAPDIRIADIARYLIGHGIELIGEKIEDEVTVVELLDLDAGYAQGHLFGPPSPIREEFLAETEEAFKIAV
ncbi:MAG: diguanylate phosphodiesterase [Robiginitomaculum sp.]|nr:MAG: diguanylate phosphodiesterase [Robiginitomaculum sp.]